MTFTFLLATSLLLLAAHLARLSATRLGVALGGTGGSTEVLEGLASGATPTEEDGVGASGVTDSELVEGEALTASLLDASAGSVGEAEGADRHLGDVEDAGIVNNSADDDGSVVETLLHVGVDAGEGHDRAVVLALHEALEDLLVEGRGGATAEELVELHKESEVGILAAGELSLVLSLAVAVELVNGLWGKKEIK